MASGSFKQVDVQCPFYIVDDGKSFVSCEGPGRARKITQVFRNRKDFEEHLQEKCNQINPECRLYDWIMEKYKEGD